ncbi:MAG: metal-dependent hydrolase [Chitinophagaceae bacterium]
MDSLTHIVLGAAIGDRILGKSIGRKAAFFGALAKTVPDFDLFISGLNDDRKYILYHRSYTHSFFVELALVFPLAWLCHYFFKASTTLKQWLFLWGACLIGHSVVDMFTNYGTRLFLPFSNKAVSLNNMAIADIFLTLPITVLVVWALLKANDSRARRRLMVATLVYATLYFDWTFVNKAIAHHHFKQSLDEQQVRIDQSMSNPSILNNFLWYSVVNSKHDVYVGTYSIFQGNKPIRWKVFPMNKKVQDSIPSPDRETMHWFSQGFYFCRREADTLYYYIPKFGPQNLSANDADSVFLFRYQLYRDDKAWQMKMKKREDIPLKPKEALKELGEHILGTNP